MPGCNLKPKTVISDQLRMWLACRRNGLYELTQVKFTADPMAHSLNWEWLTARKGSGTSLLQKWANTTLYHRSKKTLAFAVLKTDRIPDSSFMDCLNGKKVDYTRLSAKDKAVIDDQLESPERAVAFLENFEFLHSKLRLDDFETQLWSRVASDTDRGGWLSFRHHVEWWSTRKGQPAPDGKIKYNHLHQGFPSSSPNRYRKILLCHLPTTYQTKISITILSMKSQRPMALPCCGARQDAGKARTSAIAPHRSIINTQPASAIIIF